MRLSKIYYLLPPILCLIGCSGEGKGELEVIVNLPESGEVLGSSILLEDSINPRRDETSSWELTLDERSELLKFFCRAKRMLSPGEALKWEGSGNLTFTTVKKEFWTIGLFLVGDKLIFKVSYPDGENNYFEAQKSAASFTEKLKRLFG